MNLSIHNAVLDRGSRIVNIGIENGLINKIFGDPIPVADKAINDNGNLITPPFFESHFHLDNTLLVGEIIQSCTSIGIALCKGIKLPRIIMSSDG